MPKNETLGGNSEQSSPVTHIGEAEGMHSMRVDLVEHRGSLVALLAQVGQSLESPFLTIADTELRPNILRSIALIDRLISDEEIEEETKMEIIEELRALDIVIFQGMKERSSQSKDVIMDAIRTGVMASDDHVTAVPENWQENPQ